MALGLPLAREAFIDRMYEDDGTLQSRKIKGSVLKDPVAAAERCLRMVETGEIVAASGKKLALKFESLCVHGDEPTAIAVAQACRQALAKAGVEVVDLPSMLK